MKVAGIIAEYNPFHTGHLWQLEETRRRGATHLVVVMSGCYVQRGEPAHWDKWARAKAALLGGADLVLELPLPYATATAQRFAGGAVALLEGLGVVDTLCFGSESGVLEELAQAVDAILDSRVEERMAPLLTEGSSYAAARQQAVTALYGEAVARLLASPNNILGIEYMAALRRRGSTIAPMTVARQGAGHDATDTGQYASGSALRQMAGEGSWEAVSAFLPERCQEVFSQAREAGACLVPGFLERPMLARLRRMSVAQLGALPDVAEGLENRIYQAVRTAGSMEELLDTVKTKRYTHARLRRILLSAWLDIPAGLSAEPPPYIHLLGMTGAGEALLALAGKRATLPISASVARLEELGERENRWVRLEAQADDLYGAVTRRMQPCGRDYTNSIIKLP